MPKKKVRKKSDELKKPRKKCNDCRYFVKSEGVIGVCTFLKDTINKTSYCFNWKVGKKKGIIEQCLTKKI